MKNLPMPCNLSTKPLIARLAIFVAAAALSGCGGGGGGGDSTSVNPSSAPIATSSAVSTLEDVPTSGTLTASDPDRDPLTYRIASQPTMGSAVITDVTSGSFTYTPDPDKNGTDNFTFVASDGSSDSNSADVTITINADNDAPVAEAGTLPAVEDSQANGTLNASDPDGDALSYSIDSPPSMGSAVIDDAATGDYTYTPDPDQNGTDSFTFKANDGSSDSNIATVTVTVNPVNDPPVAVGGCGSTLQAQTLPGTLSATDPDVPALLTYRLDADGSGGSGPIITAKGGTVTLTDPTTGAFTYQPDTSTGDKRGVDSFDYQVSDTEGGVSSATETIVVNETIMPLGDSITMGSDFTGGTFGDSDFRVGYRKPLFDTLGISGYTFDFVGSFSDGSALLSDSDHEGHGGWTAFDIAWGQNLDGTDGVFAWLDDNPADIILLHAGTNELFNTTENDIADILDEIERWENSAGGNPITVILALIIDQDPINPDVTTFNSNVLAMANSRITAGDDIIVVNQQAALVYPGDLSDDVHPNDNGYAKMANVWLDALTKIPQDRPDRSEVALDKCP